MRSIVPSAFGLLLLASSAFATSIPGFKTSEYFQEQVREQKLDSGVRMVVNAPAADKFDPAKPTLLVTYTTPNGNSIENTLGCKLEQGMDWHFDIQHIAAQTRRLREIDSSRNLVVAVLEADVKSWPAWRTKRPDNGKIIRKIIDDLAADIPGKPLTLAITGHSGGGSFIFGYLNGGEQLEDRVERISWLDANYAYADSDHHGEKLLAWLNGSPTHHLIILAYDDRNIMLDGKKVVSDTGGTWRSSERMIKFFNGHETKLAESKDGDFVNYASANGQIRFFMHTNPQNKILHTVLVGEMNGFLQVLTLGTPLEGKWGTWGGPRAYAQWIQPAAKPQASTKPSAMKSVEPSGKIPARPKDAMGGAALMEKLAGLTPAEREATILKEISAGNFPQFLRKFQTVQLKSPGHVAEIQVMPDYLALGSDEDFVRIPMLPGTAQKIADALGCSLPTRKLTDDIYRAAEVKLKPQPMTEAREAVPTFLQHNRMIEEQRGKKPLGALTAGDKKDIVITNRLKEKPHKVAIYGWHQPDGKAIQPLTIVHGDAYVDYSHGVRLIDQKMKVDGKEMSLEDVLKNPTLASLVSDEGAIDPPRYP